MTNRNATAPETAPDVVYTRVSEGAVLLSTEEEVYYGLNPVGARVWELLEAGRSVEEICAQIREEFEGADEATVRDDVDDILEDLAGFGLIRVPEGSL